MGLGMFFKNLSTFFSPTGSDEENPDDATVALMEEMVMDYVTEVTKSAAQVGSKKGTIQPEDVVFVVRKDRKKYARSLELLSKHEEIKKAKKQFGDS